MSFLATINRTLFKRSSTFAVVVMGSAFFFERTFDLISDNLFETMNKGKLWKDLEKKLAAAE